VSGVPRSTAKEKDHACIKTKDVVAA